MSGKICFIVLKKKRLSTLQWIKTWFLRDSRLSSHLPDCFKIESFSLLLDIVAYYEQKTIIVRYVTLCLTGGNEEWLLCVWISYGAREENKKWSEFFLKGKMKRNHLWAAEWMAVFYFWVGFCCLFHNGIALASPSFCCFLDLSLITLWYGVGCWVVGMGRVYGYQWKWVPIDGGSSAPARLREPRRTALLIPGRRRLHEQQVGCAGTS